MTHCTVSSYHQTSIQNVGQPSADIVAYVLPHASKYSVNRHFVQFLRYKPKPTEFTSE